MKITSKGRYAVTAMLDVAINMKDRPVTLSDISTRQGISLSYLEQLFSKVRKAGLVKSIRGPGGGYLLNDTPENITVAMIIASVNEKLDATQCKNKNNCRQGQKCLTHSLWNNLSHKIEGFLSDITLAELMKP